MLTWGFLVFAGLALIFIDLNKITRARMLGNPMLIHIIVIGSGLLIHGGSANGAMAAIVSGVFSAIAVRIFRRMFGYIRGKEFFPGMFQLTDPRSI